LVFWQAFSLPYTFDDVDQLQGLATMRSGQISTMSWLFLKHNEHIVPMVRLYFWLGTRISGLDAWALHIMVLLTYVAGAFGSAWIFLSLTRSRFGTFLAGTIYAGAAGFSGSVAWQPAIAPFSLAGTPLIFAMAILVGSRVWKRSSLILVLAMVLLASLGMGS